MHQPPVLNLAFYLFTRIADPVEWRSRLRERCGKQPFKGTLLISTEGMNGMLSGDPTALRELQSYLLGFEEFSELTFKESWSSEVAFPRMLVKVKKEIIPLGLPHIDPNQKTGARLTPKELKKWFDEGRDFFLLDTRNDYEVDYGTFKNAHRMDINHFRDFPKKLEALSQADRSKPLVMFCTGGIRCEKASVVAMDQGYQNVFQLDGGILKYFEECGGEHYEGRCFVFDRRVALNPDLSESIPMPNSST